MARTLDRQDGLCVDVDKNGRPILTHTDGTPVAGVRSIEVSAAVDDVVRVKAEIIACTPMSKRVTIKLHDAGFTPSDVRQLIELINEEIRDDYPPKN